MVTLARLIAAVKATEASFIRLSRLRALALLGDARLSAKALCAEELVEAIEGAAALGAFLARYYQVRQEPVCWAEAEHPLERGLLRGRRLESDKLEAEIWRCETAIGGALAWLREGLAASSLLSPVLPLLEQVGRSTPASAPREPEIGPRPRPVEPGVKALEGPLETGFDPAFEPTYSLLQAPLPGFGETAKEVAPCFWALAVRESLAAELCALSIAEYDGLPLDFYRDLAKQSWDEMRHSLFFFEAAVEQLDALEALLEPSDPLLRNIARFRREGTGLPIPKERNLYEAILNASLVERLILLHRDTETPGIARIREKIEGAYCRSHPEMAEALRIVMRDEVTHARLGRVWLEHLVPRSDEREQLIEETELLRGVRLLASFAHHGEESLGALMARYAAGAKAPVSPIEGA
jgi:hypothetical protein